MNPSERKKLIDLYEKRFLAHGAKIETLGWKNADDQKLRFEVLSSGFGDLSHRTVCDVGCGFGDLKPFLEARWPGVKYTGVDLSPSLLQQAAVRFPNDRFLLQDILAPDFNECFDVFFLSGALSYRLEDNLGFTRAMLSRMFSLSRLGVAANFLSSYCNFQHLHNYHANPEEMFTLAKELTPSVALRHDYPLYEFTLFLHCCQQEYL